MAPLEREERGYPHQDFRLPDVPEITPPSMDVKKILNKALFFRLLDSVPAMLY